MWYKLLTDNEYAEYLMHEDDPENNTEKQEENALKMLDKLGDIVYGVTMAWSFRQDGSQPPPTSTLGMPRHMFEAYTNCIKILNNTTTASLPEILNSIPQGDRGSNTYLDTLTPEQCAVDLMYPFWSRMGGSFEQEFRKNGELKRYLLALKNKLENPDPNQKEF